MADGLERAILAQGEGGGEGAQPDSPARPGSAAVEAAGGGWAYVGVQARCPACAPRATAPPWRFCNCCR